MSVELHFVATLLLTVLVGLSLGLLGGGGSILMVPILTYVTGMEAQQAIVVSLIVVGTTAAVSTLGHARHGRVQWRTGLLFGAAGMVGAFAGGLLGGHLPAQVLMIAFALMMLATAVAMIRGKKTTDSPRTAPEQLPMGKVLIEGLIVGLATGIVGAGGGFLVVPALVLLAGLPMSTAVGTSLLVIAMKSVAGVAGYLTTTSVDWVLAAALTTVAILGSVAGSRLQARIPEQALRQAFGWFVVGIGILVLVQELPGQVTLAAFGVAGLSLIMQTLCRLIPSTARACSRAFPRKKIHPIP